MVKLEDVKKCPILEKLKSLFGISEKDTIIAYGDVIYTPAPFSRDLIVHELTHCERQDFNRNTAEQWWKKYIEDKSFREQEEGLAYRQQYLFCQRVYKDKNRLAKIAHALAL